MKNLKTLILFPAMLFFVLTAQAQTTPYKSVDGNFSALFPGTPSQEVKDVSTDAGMLKMYSFMYQNSDATTVYMIAYCDYPSDFTEKFDKKEMLQKSMNGYLKSLKLTKDFSESILLDYKHEGIYFGANADDMRSRNYNYIVGSRLYQVGILTVDPSMAESEFTIFLKSFKLLK